MKIRNNKRNNFFFLGFSKITKIKQKKLNNNNTITQLEENSAFQLNQQKKFEKLPIPGNGAKNLFAKI